MKNKTKKIKSNDYYNYESIEDINKDISKTCINNENNFDDIFQKIDMLHKGYQSHTFSTDFFLCFFNLSGGSYFNVTNKND